MKRRPFLLLLLVAGVCACATPTVVERIRRRWSLDRRGDGSWSFEIGTNPGSWHALRCRDKAGNVTSFVVVADDNGCARWLLPASVGQPEGRGRLPKDCWLWRVSPYKKLGGEVK